MTWMGSNPLSYLSSMAYIWFLYHSRRTSTPSAFTSNRYPAAATLVLFYACHHRLMSTAGSQIPRNTFGEVLRPAHGHEIALLGALI